MLLVAATTVYRIKVVASVGELVAALQAEHGQTPCQGFKLFHGHLYWLNNSLTQDPGRFWEYLVVQPTGDGRIVYEGETPVGVMPVIVVDSVTVNGTLTPEALDEHAQHLEREPVDRSQQYGGALEILVDMRPYGEHNCEVCR